MLQKFTKCTKCTKLYKCYKLYKTLQSLQTVQKLFFVQKFTNLNIPPFPSFPQFRTLAPRGREPALSLSKGQGEGAGIQRLSIPLFCKEGQGEVEPEALVQDVKIIGGGRRLCRNEYADFTFHLTEVA